MMGRGFLVRFGSYTASTAVDSTEELGFDPMQWRATGGIKPGMSDFVKNRGAGMKWGAGEEGPATDQVRGVSGSHQAGDSAGKEK